MPYTVELSPAAQRQIRKLAPPVQRRIIQRLEGLAALPRPPDARKLAGAEDLYRVRSGEYRIIYQIVDERLVILIVRVGHRREVYRQL